jgi:hypothetical protein
MTTKQNFALIVAALASASVVSAQTPSYRGALVISPSANNGKCLTSQNGNANGSPVVIGDCIGDDTQHFTFANGAVTAYGGTKCLDVTDGNDINGVKLQLWDCWPNSANQQWWWTGDNHLAWTNHGRCLDLTDGSQANGNRVQLWDCSGGNGNQIWNVGYLSNNLPQQSQDGQTGYNNCGTGSSPSSMCQTLWLNSVDDFCVWGPPTVNPVGNAEREMVAYCSKSGHGSRVMPQGTLTGVHFVKTPKYVQITGQGDFTKINIPGDDAGGELDNHGADGNGNPIGGLVYGNAFGSGQQFHEWTNFMSAQEFCIRACVGPDAAANCQHIYDTMGCYWNMPANYDAGAFESCDGDVGEPMGVYGTSTWYQGVSPTPSAHSPPASSNCVPTASVAP